MLGGRGEEILQVCARLLHDLTEAHAGLFALISRNTTNLTRNGNYQIWPMPLWRCPLGVGVLHNFSNYLFAGKNSLI